MFIVELLLLVFEKMLVAFFFCIDSFESIDNFDSFERIIEIEDCNYKNKNRENKTKYKENNRDKIKCDNKIKKIE